MQLLTVDDCVLVHEMTIGMIIICHDRGMNMHAHVLQSKDWCWRATAPGRTPCPNRVSALEKLIRCFAENPGDNCCASAGDKL